MTIAIPVPSFPTDDLKRQGHFNAMYRNIRRSALASVESIGVKYSDYWSVNNAMQFSNNEKQPRFWHLSLLIRLAGA